MTQDPPVAGLAGLRTLITGGSAGIGAVTAELLSARGARVVTLDRNEGPERTSAVAHVVADITRDDEVAAAVAEAGARLGGLDAIVCNAGIGAVGTVLDNPVEEWHHVFDVNVIGAVRVLRAAVPLLAGSPAPGIVTVCSVVAEVGFPARALYSASKGALLALTMSMAADLLPAGIRVNAVCPGTTDTPWVERLLDGSDDPGAARAALERRQPTGRLVAPAEVSAAIAYLLDPAARSTTGTVVHVDGGLTRLRPPAPQVRPS